ncbi:MAG: AAA family ATPase [Candidatus Eremiobacteraeota bacterium]|nr:AAA family ATPase [Candidatus Eremiobacteraeota bacterium]
MELFVDGILDPRAFDVKICQGTDNLDEILMSAIHTQSGKVESTHFLIALAKIPGGFTRGELSRMGLTVSIWESGLSSSAIKNPGSPPLLDLACGNFHKSALALLNTAKEIYEKKAIPRITEHILLYSALEHITDKTACICKDAHIDLENWRKKIKEEYIEPREVVVIEVFEKESPHRVILDSFSPGGKKVLRLMKSEAESLGYGKFDPRHLLLALLEYKGGATQQGIFRQGLLPKKVQEVVMLGLQNRAKRTRSEIPLDNDEKHMQPLLGYFLVKSGKLAGKDRVEKVTEAHILRSFLSEGSMAREILEDEGVNIESLLKLAKEFEEEDEEEDEVLANNIDKVRQHMKEYLVGQDMVIERILPYIQRMRFGFTTPGRPVGVFLFCGQSGSGKTEMAKQLAHAVYGSEENLIFLEMGQFKKPESMNIFVGAPPGYVGYGEGKLTNGLRDKPQAVVLFDEVEKACEQVLDTLLRFLDEGMIDDPAGPVRDGTQCIVILSSNVGADKLSEIWEQVKNNPHWRIDVRKKLRELFKKEKFRVEFLNRVDELMLFRTLEVKDYIEIAKRMLKKDLERLKKERQVDVILHDEVCESIGLYCNELAEGARAVRRLTQQVVITPVIDFVIRNPISPPLRLKVGVQHTAEDSGLSPDSGSGMKSAGILDSRLEPVSVVEFA